MSQVDTCVQDCHTSYLRDGLQNVHVGRVVGPSSKVVLMDAAGRERRRGEQGGRSCRLKGARPVLPSWGLSSLAPAVEVQGRRLGRLPAPEKCDGHRSGDGPPQAFSPGGITTWLPACPLAGEGPSPSPQQQVR